jgi:hypothetical protein
MPKPYFRQVPNFEYTSRDYGKQNISDYVEVKNLFKRGKLREEIFGNLSFFEKYTIIGDERPDNVAYKIYNDSVLDWVVLLSNNILNIQSEWPMTQRTFDEVMLEKYGSYEELYSGIHHYETIEIRNSEGITILPAGIKSDELSSFRFDETRRRFIKNITCDDGKTVIVTLQNPIENISEGTDIIISDSLPQYNGRFKIDYTFTDENITQFSYLLDTNYGEALQSSNSGTFHVVIATNYLRYYDNGKDIQMPSTDYLIPVTNYEYESQIENNKRNIYVLKPRYLNVVFNDLENIMIYKQGSGQYVSRTLKRADDIRLN